MTVFTTFRHAFAALLREAADGIAPAPDGTTAADAPRDCTSAKTLKALISTVEALMYMYDDNPHMLVDSLIAEIRVAKERLS